MKCSEGKLLNEVAPIRDSPIGLIFTNVERKNCLAKLIMNVVRKNCLQKLIMKLNENEAFF